MSTRERLVAMSVRGHLRRLKPYDSSESHCRPSHTNPEQDG